MSYFPFIDGVLHAENVTASALADRYGTPTYVYSRTALESHYQAYADAMGPDDLVCYAVKANSNIAVLNVLARLGAGFDIVSVGELERVLLAGGDPDRVVFSGVAKKSAEMRRALDVGIHCFNVESEAELERLNQVAGEMNAVAPVSLRVNPDVDAQTHPYISTGLKENKFGIGIDDALAVYERAQAMQYVDVIGVDCHIGSQLTDTQPFLDAMDRVLALVDALASKGILLEHVDLGGGLGVTYEDEQPPAAGDYIRAIKAKLAPYNVGLVVEPGRSIAANAGILLTEVEYLKSNGDKHFAIIDAAMNDMIRPALYQAWMDMQAVAPSNGTSANYDLVGPVCETGDFLGKDRQLTLAAGDIVAQFSAGAYGFTMASNYNTRGRAAEVMVDGDKHYLIREREDISDMVRGESLIP
ncbi:Diaminopimelate decarboxylase [BD1-7 clade bacterium]|uniref:Diaminopimelate decarboxylase n=1 Tax=BD1-7 clade bacterium TaxID=2029982 RepID=A0A5S9QBG8_9GAMM|nr:Diaminopimelate decarboxylase [BD1-7 clade bacterium]